MPGDRLVPWWFLATGAVGAVCLLAFVTLEGCMARVSFRAVKPGTSWDPVRVTRNTRPEVADRPLLSLRPPRHVPGHAGHDGDFPQPNLRALVHNVRLYHELGARGVFMETDAPGLNSGIHCGADMTSWVPMQALWDPARCADELIDDFCLHHCGPAGEFITRYVARLEDAYARGPRLAETRSLGRRGAYEWRSGGSGLARVPRATAECERSVPGREALMSNELLVQ